MNTDIPNPLKVSVFNVFMSIRTHLSVCLFETAVFSPVWRINTAENGHRKHIFLKSLQSRYFGKKPFLQYSLGWMKTEVFTNVYVMVLHGLRRRHGLRDTWACCNAG